MDKNKRNALQRARLSSGLTQEALAERSGYSADSVRAWESGARMASLEALGILGEVLDAPWLPGVYLREQSTALNDLLPDFEVDRPLAEAAAEYVSCILELVDQPGGPCAAADGGGWTNRPGGTAGVRGPDGLSRPGQQSLL